MMSCSKYRVTYLRPLKKKGAPGNKEQSLTLFSTQKLGMKTSSKCRSVFESLFWWLYIPGCTANVELKGVWHTNVQRTCTLSIISSSFPLAFNSFIPSDYLPISRCLPSPSLPGLSVHTPPYFSLSVGAESPQVPFWRRTHIYSFFGFVYSVHR